MLHFQIQILEDFPPNFFKMWTQTKEALYFHKGDLFLYKVIFGAT